MNLVTKIVAITAVQFLNGDTAPLTELVNGNPNNQVLTEDHTQPGLYLSDTRANADETPNFGAEIKNTDWLCRYEDGSFSVKTNEELLSAFMPIEEAIAKLVPQSIPQPGLVNEAISPAPAQPEKDEFVLPHEVDAATKGFAIARPDINPTHNGHVALVKNQGAHLINMVGNIPHDGNSDTARWKSIAITNIETGLLYAEKAAVAK